MTVRLDVARPGAIYTVGHNYRDPREPRQERPDRPLIYGKAASSFVGDGATIVWDRTVTDDVDAEVELGVVIGSTARDVRPIDVAAIILGYTIVNDISSRDARLDGDQWLLGKSMPGFCPAGPWVVPAAELDPTSLRLGCAINGEAIQDGTTADMRFRIDEIVSFLSQHIELRPDDLIAHWDTASTFQRAWTRPPPSARRRRDVLDRGDRRADDDHRLTTGMTGHVGRARRANRLESGWRTMPPFLP